MGYKLRVATKYQVEHDRELASFNYKSTQINLFLYEHCPDIAWNDDREGCEYAISLEIPKSDLIGLIAWVASHRDEYAQWAEENGIDEDADQFIRIIAHWLVVGDPDNQFVALFWY